MRSSRPFVRVLATGIASVGLVFAGVGVASAASAGATSHQVSQPSDSSSSLMSPQKRDSGW